MTPTQIKILKQYALATLGAGAVAVTLFWGSTDPVTGYPDPITVDGETIEFTWTDDNTDETLHIYTDKQTYENGLSNADVYVAVVNTTSVWQNVELNGYFKNQLRHFGTAAVLTVVDWEEPVTSYNCSTYDKKTYDRLVSQKKIVIGVDLVSEIASSTTYDVCSPVDSVNSYQTNEWLELPLAPRDLFEVTKEQDYLALEGVSKKQVENFIAEYKTFQFPVGPGQTIYYKLNIEYPANDVGNFYLEAIGDRGGYGHLDPWFDAAWGYRVAIEVNPSYVSGSTNLTNYPVYLDLSELPAEFHTNVKSDGCDIRVVESDETTETPFELVEYDSTGDTGELHFLADSLSYTATTTFYVYYGNSGASCYGVSDTYGTYNVWPVYTMVLHMTGASATDIDDSSGNGNDIVGTTGSATFLYDQTGKVGEAVDISAGSSYPHWYVNHSTTLDFQGDFTTTAWINLDQTSRRTGVFDKGNNTSANNYYSAMLESDNTFRVLTRDSSSASDHHNTTDTFTNNTWYYTSWRRDKSSNFYIDVNGVNKKTEPDSISNYTGTEVFYIGGIRHSNAGMDGTIDEFRHAESVLTTDWLVTEYNNQNSPSTFTWVGDEESNGGGAARRVLFIQ